MNIIIVSKYTKILPKNKIFQNNYYLCNPKLPL